MSERAGQQGGQVDTDSDIERIHYIVEMTVPTEAKAHDGSPRWYGRNVGLDVIADDLIQAAQTALARHPNGTLHVVRKVGASTRLLVAPVVQS